ncbi:MAG: stage II sporulation protein P, partial [Clostridia bacterium]|nr:stage II sporulation protein P [Clostridia bacterium]
YSVYMCPQEVNSSVDYKNVFAPDLTYNSEKKEEENVLAVTAEEKKTAVATAGGEALGKVIERTIKTGNANLSSNGVHINNSTGLEVNISSLLKSKLGYTIKKNEHPQVLIVHTHATESFLSEDRDYYTASDKSRTTDNSFNVTALGEIVADKLNSSGIKTLHDTTQHDYPSYNQSYSRAAKTITGYLDKYPSIKVVIDIHRDSVQSGSTKTKLTAEIDGKTAAQVMLVMGSQSGNVKNFPKWKENLKLALKFQKNIEETYPYLARPLSLMSRSYNERLTTGSMLLEIGTEANSFDEAKYSAELISNSLIKTLESTDK